MYSIAGSSEVRICVCQGSMCFNNNQGLYLEAKSLLGKVTVCVSANLRPEILLFSSSSWVMNYLGQELRRLVIEHTRI